MLCRELQLRLCGIHDVMGLDTLTQKLDFSEEITNFQHSETRGRCETMHVTDRAAHSP